MAHACSCAKRTFHPFQGKHVLMLDKLQAGANQQTRIWGAWWLDASRLFWSSGDVVARRGLLFAQSGPAALFDPDFDKMGSEKQRAAVEAWMAMSMKAAQFMPGWGLQLWLNALQPAATPRAAQRRIEASGLRAAGEALQINQAGMRSVQRQVSINAKRLGKKKTKR